MSSRPGPFRDFRSLLVLAAICAACVPTEAEVAEPVPTLFDEPVVPADADTTTASSASTTTAPVAGRLPALDSDISGAIRSADGTGRAILGTDGEVWRVTGACEAEAVEPAATAELIGPHHVVLDPGDGGAARGIEIGGVEEAALNLEIAERVATQLEEVGVAVILSRTTDTELSESARGALGPALGARALVSIHHGEPSEESVTASEPQPATFHRADDSESRRLAGLLHEELRAALAPLSSEWTAASSPGTRFLLNQRGQDYFVALESSTPTAAARVEAVALGAAEAALLSRDAVMDAEATALASAIIRFLVTEEAGDGFVESEEIVRQAPTSNTPGGCG